MAIAMALGREDAGRVVREKPVELASLVVG
jgi:hypothetical protein